ncbi:sulfotransferase [sulfur-oxidizing endosymbiont of Gigantopelta aegis]|uniref:sulfotransferase n=1 Tax=sulfur-oxidizing endosymbiont of Gigantopelta aegis TaxID=2794934 RepID=UPI0018DBC336|nr:sulfotransferase [sulfur-oxidizing endosymbiont of Gigantopelta aegis]
MNKPISRNAACTCGSGKKFKYCCGKENSTPNTYTENIAESLSLGAQALEAKDYALAEPYCLKAVTFMPSNAIACYLYALCLKQQNKKNTSLKFFNKALKNGLKDAAALYHYGLLLLETKKPDEAIVQLKKSLSLKTNFAEPAFILANIYYEQFNFLQAERFYQKTLSISPKHTNALFNYAHVLYQQFNYPKALEYLQQYIQIMSTDPKGLAEIARLFEQMNDLEQAHHFAEKTLKLEPDNLDATTTLVKYYRRSGETTKALQLSESLNIENYPERLQVQAWNELGRIQELKSNFDNAFSAFSKAKTCLLNLQKYFPYNDLNDSLQLNQTIAEQTKTNLIFNPKTTSRKSYQAIFIIGFFRSGTTLLEKVLSSYPEVASLGESDSIQSIENDFNPALLKRSGKQESKKNQRLEKFLEAKRQSLLSFTSNQLVQSDYKYVIDKQLFNQLRIPLIHLLDPNALFIRVIRHPLDIAISCFSEIFSQRFNWSYDLNTILEYIIEMEEN